MVKSWSQPEVPRLPGDSQAPRIWDTASASLASATPDGIARIYVCGITPYDSTHIGHAATYLAFDTLIRTWLDAGYEVHYVQNTTDVDDPLLERAAATGVDWRDLAADQTERFRRDMETLRIIPPNNFVAVTEKVDAVARAVGSLFDRGIAYRVENDIYFDIAAAENSSPWHLGDESHLDGVAMLALSAERGGDPERPGKRDPLDPLLWRGEREGEPSWPSSVGAGRPGWHIECSVIAAEYLELPLTVKGGGSDLIFPHHEFSAGHTATLDGVSLASLYSHAGLVSYQGEKMSKSLGNLVFVSELTAAGTDPRAIRLALLSQHYRTDWEWTGALLADAEKRLALWQDWARLIAPGESALTGALRSTLHNDLDTPRALQAIDAHIERGATATTDDVQAIDALLGIRLTD
jgi:L-cysteine:1D-myo-inositol 2-amino-2-deoxy-alpha-D-glucopyranoside ligase